MIIIISITDTTITCSRVNKYSNLIRVRNLSACRLSVIIIIIINNNTDTTITCTCANTSHLEKVKYLINKDLLIYFQI